MAFATKVLVVCLSLIAMGHALRSFQAGMGRYGMGMGYPMGMYPNMYPGMYPGMFPGMYPGMGYGMLNEESGGEFSSGAPNKIEDQRPMEYNGGASDIISEEKLIAFSEPTKE